MLEGYRSGRPALLTPRDKQALGDIVDSGPLAYGYLSGVWTSPMISRVIQDEFGIDYHPGHVRKLLQQLGFSVQRPQRELARADIHQQDPWHRYTYPNLKKSASRRCGADPWRRSKLSTLEETQKLYQLDRFLTQLDKTDLLVIDELGYLSFSRAGAELLFQVFTDRYERASLLITSNLAFSDWGQIFQGERMTAALLDRLTHRCHIFQMNGESYRFRESTGVKQAKKKVPATA